MASQFRPGDEVIVSIADHESNFGPWVWLEEKGVVIKFSPMNKETYELELHELDKLINDKTKLVCFTHTSNLLDTVNPVKEITNFPVVLVPSLIIWWRLEQRLVKQEVAVKK